MRYPIVLLAMLALAGCNEGLQIGRYQLVALTDMVRQEPIALRLDTVTGAISYCTMDRRFPGVAIQCFSEVWSKP